MTILRSRTTTSPTFLKYRANLCKSFMVARKYLAGPTNLDRESNWSGFSPVKCLHLFLSE